MYMLKETGCTQMYNLENKLCINFVRSLSSYVSMETHYKMFCLIQTIKAISIS